MITFELKDEMIELHRLLKTTGLCDSGGMAKLLISEGLVQVDGQVELRKRRFSCPLCPWFWQPR